MGFFLTNPFILKVRTLALELLKVPGCPLLFFKIIFLLKEVEIREFSQHAQKLLLRPGWNILWISVESTYVAVLKLSSVLHKGKNLYAMTTMFVGIQLLKVRGPPMLIWTHFKVFVGLVGGRQGLWTVLAQFLNYPYFWWAFNKSSYCSS